MAYGLPPQRTIQTDQRYLNTGGVATRPAVAPPRPNLGYPDQDAWRNGTVRPYPGMGTRPPYTTLPNIGVIGGRPGGGTWPGARPGGGLAPFPGSPTPPAPVRPPNLGGAAGQPGAPPPMLGGAASNPNAGPPDLSGGMPTNYDLSGGMGQNGPPDLSGGMSYNNPYARDVREQAAMPTDPTAFATRQALLARQVANQQARNAQGQALAGGAYGSGAGALAAMAGNAAQFGLAGQQAGQSALDSDMARQLGLSQFNAQLGQEGNIANWELGQGDYRLNQDDRRLRQSEYELGQGDWRLRQGDAGLGMEAWRNRQGDYQLGQGDWDRRQGDYQLGQGDWDRRQRDYGLGQDDYRLGQGDRGQSLQELIAKMEQDRLDRQARLDEERLKMEQQRFAFEQRQYGDEEARRRQAERDQQYRQNQQLPYPSAGGIPRFFDPSLYTPPGLR